VTSPPDPAPAPRGTIVWLAWRMLWYNRPRFGFAVAGIAGAFFLAAAQFGLLVGWIGTITALIRHAPTAR
jgi:putative ABC transport system permease protein